MTYDARREGDRVSGKGDPDSRLQVWLAELDEINGAISGCEQFKTQTFVFGTAGVVALLTSAIGLHNANSNAEPLVLLLVVVLCSVLGMFLVDRDEVMLGLLQYRENVIKPRIREITGDEVALGYKEFYNREFYGRNRSFSRKIAHRLTAPFPHALFYIAGAGSWGYLLAQLLREEISGAWWIAGVSVGAFTLVWSYAAAFLTGAQWANLAAPSDEKGIPFARRRKRCALPRPQGWLPGDPHAHTDWSDGNASVWSQAAAAAGRGLHWLGIADHTDGIGEDWKGYVSSIAEVEGRIGQITLLPCAEVTVVDAPGGTALGDCVVYGWPVDGPPPPANRSFGPDRIAAMVHAQRHAFAGVVHPNGGGAPFGGAIKWRGWEVPGYRTLELLSNERAASKTTIDRWFGLLAEGVETAVDGGRFVAATGGTDSHRPFDKPGTKGMTWVAVPDDKIGRKSILRALGSGRSVVSGLGDFGTIAIRDAGPGEVAQADTVRLTVTVSQRPMVGRHCVSVELLSSDQVALAARSGAMEPEFLLEIDAHASGGFIVARFEFRAIRGRGRPAQAWTNPIFLDRSRLEQRFQREPRAKVQQEDCTHADDDPVEAIR